MPETNDIRWKGDPMNREYYSRYNQEYEIQELWMTITGNEMLIDRKDVRYDLISNVAKLLTPEIKKVIHNNPATIVLWGDGTKTVVTCQEEDRHRYSERVGFLMCIAKKFFGNTSAFNDILKEHSSDDIPDIKLPKLDDIAIDKKDVRSINIKN